MSLDSPVVYQPIYVYQLLAVLGKTADSEYQAVGYFVNEETAAEAAQLLLAVKRKILKTRAMQNTTTLSEVYLLGAPAVVADNLQDLKRRGALAKLTLEERDLLGIKG